MRLLLCLILLLSLPLSIDGRGGRGGAGRGRSQGRSRSGSKWGYGQGKSTHGNGGSYGASGGYHGSWGGTGAGHRVRGGSSGGHQPFIRKTDTVFYRAGVGSFHKSTVAKTAIGAAAMTLAVRIFGNNVIREKEKPLKVDGISYYWSAEYVPQSTTTTVCALHVDKNDTNLSNITFADLKKVDELAWSCATTTYCCGLSCCRDGYEGSPLGTVGSIGLGLLSLSALFIPVVALVSLQRGVSPNDLK